MPWLQSYACHSVKKPTARRLPDRWTSLRPGAAPPRSPRESSCGSTSSPCASLAAVAWALFTHGTRPHAEPHLPWWAVALGFAVAEICVVHVRFRRSAHSFSLADVPFVFGLVFATGDDFVLGALVGTAIVYGLIRRLRARQARSSTSPSSRSPRCVAAAMLHLVAGNADALQPETWVGLYAATLASGALTILLLGGAIAIAEGNAHGTPMLVQMFATDALVTLINASIAIAAALVVATDPRAVPVLLVPALTVFAVYRAYISERQRHERLEFLYDANRTLSRSPEVAEALEALLARSLEAFNADIAEVAAVHRRRRRRCAPRTARATRADDGARPTARSPRSSPAWSTPRTPSSRSPRPSARPHLRAHMQARGIRHAMIAMLPGEERTIGTIMLANRVGLERSFGADDLRLLEALANNAAVALQYDRLEQAVNKLQSLQDQLHHQAYHDPLTDLPNRTLFMERVREELADDGEVAVLFVDVDDFKTVNDSLGHARRRRAAASRSPSACAAASAPRTRSPASAATSSRYDPGRRRPAGRRPRRGPPHPEGLRAAGRGRHASWSPSTSPSASPSCRQTAATATS